ncbi:MAG: hypothetical protein ACE5GK_12735 [Nitrospiria bacterium]
MEQDDGGGLADWESEFWKISDDMLHGQKATFKVSDAQLEALWTANQQVDFFSLEPKYASSDIVDGAFASLTIRALGRTHQVEVENISVPRFQDLLKSINRITPPGMDLRYMSSVLIV